MSGAERTLGISDAFNAGNWQEGSYTPVGSTAQIQALGVPVACGVTEPETLEFRFSGTQGFVLKARVAQDLYSPDPKANLEFALVVDGRQVATQRIKFKGSAELNADLSGVAVVELQVKQAQDDSANCPDGAATALVTSLVMTSQ